jgi:hypothetical protein
VPARSDDEGEKAPEISIGVTHYGERDILGLWAGEGMSPTEQAALKCLYRASPTPESRGLAPALRLARNYWRAMVKDR